MYAASAADSPVIVEKLEGLFDGAVLVLTSPIDAGAVRLIGPREAALIAAAAPKRRNEFATARKLARQALADLGLSNFEILHDSMRAPLWPHGIAGSLSHCGKRAVAAIGYRNRVGTLGIDTEDRPILPEELWPLVLTPEEQRFLAGLPAAQRGSLALILFSAKESLYKAQYPRTRQFMDFSELRVELVRIDREPHIEGTLSCIFIRGVGPFTASSCVPGRFRVLPGDGTVVTAVQIRDAD